VETSWPFAMNAVKEHQNKQHGLVVKKAENYHAAGMSHKRDVNDADGGYERLIRFLDAPRGAFPNCFGSWLGCRDRTDQPATEDPSLPAPATLSPRSQNCEQYCKHY
jgi:hypothetical protein